MILCRSPQRSSLPPKPAKMGIVITTERFTDKHAKHYIHLYRTQGGDTAKKWALEILSPEPRAKMVTRVNELLKKKRG